MNDEFHGEHRESQHETCHVTYLVCSLVMLGCLENADLENTDLEIKDLVLVIL